MLLYMQAPSEASVREEHQIGGPPLTSQHVCLCRSLSLYVWVHILIKSHSICILILICNMFYVGCPWWVYCLTTYSLSCRGRFTYTGIIWNMLLIIYMLLIMFHFFWKNHFVTYISLWHMLLYVGTYCDSGAWRASKQCCCQPTSSPQTGM